MGLEGEDVVPEHPFVDITADSFHPPHIGVFILKGIDGRAFIWPEIPH
jgi:hypothetical protein